MRNIQRIRSLATTPMTFTAANTYIGQVGELVSVFDDSDGTAVALRIHDGNTVGGLLYYQINSYVAPEDTGTSGVVSDNSGTSNNEGIYSGWLNENVIDYSAYFDGTSSSYLSRTPTETGNQKTWTFSAWVKLLKTNESSYLLTNSGSDGNNGISALYFKNDKVFTYYDTTGASPYGAVGPAQFRDTSAWYHVTWVVDATNSNHKVWINNRLISTDTSKYPPDYNYDMSKFGQSMAIGAEAWGVSNYFNGYMANIQMIDGAALDASYFGETVEGNWIHRPYDGTSTVEGATPVSGLGGTNDKYGANGFYLNFADESNLGKDVSGNGNDWT